MSKKKNYRVVTLVNHKDRGIEESGHCRNFRWPFYGEVGVKHDTCDFLKLQLKAPD